MCAVTVSYKCYLGNTSYHVIYFYFLLSFIYIYLYIFIYLLKTELRILDFQHFHWLAGHRLSAHIPALPNMVNESINKESSIKKFPRNWRHLENRLAAELTSRNSVTGPKYKWNSPLHCSECFRMTKTSAIIVIKKFFS